MTDARTFDLARMRADIAAKGWLPTDLARAAGVSDMTVSRFLSGSRQNPRTAKKLASALGYSVRRYVELARQWPAREQRGSRAATAADGTAR